MSDLGQFAELMRLATADKVAKEAIEETRRLEEVVPLLSELFAAVQKEKLKPEKSNNSLKVIHKSTQKVVEDKPLTELIQKVEDKAIDLQGKATTTAIEKRFLALFNRLQDDFQALKKHVESKSSSYSGGWGGSAGSGEVRVLRMDDVDARNIQDGKMLVWDAASAKFVFVDVPIVGVPVNIRQIAINDGEMFISIQLTQKIIDRGHEIFINGMRQSKDFYVVNSFGVNISSDLQIRTGDILDFQYTQ